MGMKYPLRLLGNAVEEPTGKRYRAEVWYQAYMAAFF
jgi:hypothetical protein